MFLYKITKSFVCVLIDMLGRENMIYKLQEDGFEFEYDFSILEYYDIGALCLLTSS